MIAAILLNVALSLPTAAAPSPSIALGAYVDSAPEYNTLPAYRAMVGTPPAILMWYRNWANGPNPDFTAADLDVAYANGAMPMITWQPFDGAATGPQPSYALRTIIAGGHDPLIRRWAHATALYGRPFYLRFAHEMNGGWYPWGTAPGNPNGNTPAEYVAAWHHVHEIFVAQGAANVRWVWSPNYLGTGTTQDRYASNYPGDGYVDWVGIDVYNFGSGSPSGWMSFQSAFDSSYRALTALTQKPMMIAEIGAAQNARDDATAGHDKATWIRETFKAIPARYPLVRAVIWFNVDRSQSGDYDYRVESSPASLAMFNSFARSSLYRGRIP